MSGSVCTKCGWSGNRDNPCPSCGYSLVDRQTPPPTDGYIRGLNAALKAVKREIEHLTRPRRGSDANDRWPFFTDRYDRGLQRAVVLIELGIKEAVKDRPPEVPAVDFSEGDE